MKRYTEYRSSLGVRTKEQRDQKIEAFRGSGRRCVEAWGWWVGWSKRQEREEGANERPEELRHRRERSGEAVIKVAVKVVANDPGSVDVSVVDIDPGHVTVWFTGKVQAEPGTETER